MIVKVVASFTPITLTADVPLDQELAELAKLALREQLSHGIDANGVQHTHQDGTPWDFREGGELLDTMMAEPQKVTFTAEHAEHIHKVAPLDGLAADYLAKLEQSAQEPVERLLTVQDKKE